MMDWLSVDEFRQLAGIRREVASRLLARCLAGTQFCWRGSVLEVRAVAGRGGLSGKYYVVRLISLPPELQALWKTFQTPIEGASNHLAGHGTERAWWLRILGPALDTPKGSPARKAAFQRAIAETNTNWRGDPIKLTMRHLQHRMALLEEGSVGALGRLGRADRGVARNVISRQWDAAVPFSADLKAQIAAVVKLNLGGLFKAGMRFGQVADYGAAHLAELTVDAGFDARGDATELLRLCKVPKPWLSEAKIGRKVAELKGDHKKFWNDRPYVPRTRGHLAPMESVVADIHHFDVRFEEAGGRITTPKMIAFLDEATRRVFYDVVFLPVGEGVKNRDVIRVFMAMAQDDSWGLPQNLQIDNGKEFGFADALDDALRLAFPIVEVGTGRRSSRIIRSRPYNARAKSIEGVFGILEGGYFHLMPGHRGGRPMEARQERPGKVRKPFSAGEEAFRGAIRGLVDAYHASPQQGELKGLSPLGAFQRHVDRDWRTVVLDPTDGDQVFVDRKTRTLDRGFFKLAGGEHWTADELCRFLGDKVVVCVPKYTDGFSAVRVETPSGEFLCVARPSEVFKLNDPAGAAESRRRVKLREQAVRALDKATPDVNALELMYAKGRAAKAPAPGAPAGVVKVGLTPRRAGLPKPPPQLTAEEKISEQQRAAAERRELMRQFLPGPSSRKVS